MKKIAIGLVAAILGLALVACFISPFVAAQRLIRAARTGDVAGLEQTVDFPAFRASLKAELRIRKHQQAEISAVFASDDDVLSKACKSWHRTKPKPCGLHPDRRQKLEVLANPAVKLES